MNFEVIDNCFQILVLWCAALTATVFPSDTENAVF